VQTLKVWFKTSKSED